MQRDLSTLQHVQILHALTHAMCDKFQLANTRSERILRANTPAMPLTEAHFGGFFMPGVQA